MTGSSVNAALLQHIAEAIASIRYGTVQITVHNARVVQIDKLERVRVSPSSDLTRGSVSDAVPLDRTSGD